MLDGKHVVVIADDDDVGRQHAPDVRDIVADRASSVSVVECHAKDFADAYLAGRGLGELVPIEVPDSRIDDATPRVWRATELRAAERPRWLAESRLMYAAINLLVGDEGIGKSLLWVLLSAAVTTGKPLPKFGMPPRTPGDVFLVITEDDWCSIVLPRLIIAGADLDRVHVICTEADGSGAPVFPRDIAVIHNANPAPAMVVVDAWLDTVAPGLSVRDPQQARQALHPWKEVASAARAAVLLLTHTNRVASGSVRDRYGATATYARKRASRYLPSRTTKAALSSGRKRRIVPPRFRRRCSLLTPCSISHVRTTMTAPCRCCGMRATRC